MKLVAVDNYDRETVSDILVAENVHSSFGNRIVELWTNNMLANQSEESFLKLVPDDYKLYEFKP